MTIATILTAVIPFIAVVDRFREMSTNIFFVLIVFYLAFYFSFFIHIILHEGGHLVAGLLSGYKFVSFRVSSFIFIKTNEGIKLKRYSIKGTGGQCLLSPPNDMNDYPFLLYNFAGGFSNLIFAILGYISVLVVDNAYFDFVMITFVCVGVYLALTNLIPIKSKTFSNDGYNIVSMKKDASNKHSLWKILKVYAAQAQGKSLPEMPKEWFEHPDCDKVKNDPLSANVAANVVTYYVECGDYDKAIEYGNELLKNAPEMMELVRVMIICEMMFSLIMTGKSEQCKQYMDKRTKKMVEVLKSEIGVARSAYLYYKYIDFDKKQSEKWDKVFKKLSKNFPFENVVRDEIRRIEDATEILIKNTQEDVKDEF